VIKSYNEGIDRAAAYLQEMQEIARRSTRGADLAEVLADLIAGVQALKDHEPLFKPSSSGKAS